MQTCTNNRYDYHNNYGIGSVVQLYSHQRRQHHTRISGSKGRIFVWLSYTPNTTGLGQSHSQALLNYYYRHVAIAVNVTLLALASQKYVKQV